MFSPRTRAALAAVAIAAAAQAQPAPHTDAFTYQGSLTRAGAPVAEPVELRFRLHADPLLHHPIGGDLVRAVTPSPAGAFTVSLDFGPVFGPEARYLEIAVSDPDHPDGFVTLEPRTPIQPAPVAHYALDAPTPTLDEVSDSLLTHQPGGYVDLTTGGSFLTGLRLFDGFSRGLILSRPGIQSTLDLAITTSEDINIQSSQDFSLRSVGGRGHIETQNNLDMEAGTALKLRGQISVDINAPIMDLTATANLRINGALVRVSGGTVLVNDHVFLPTQAIFPGLLQTGSAVVNQTLQVNANAFKPGGGPWSALSDARVKKNVRPLHNSLATINALRPVSFEYADPDHPQAAPGRFRGFIAQEVAHVIPEWVSAEGEHLTLTPLGFEALAVDAIQELQARHQHETDLLREEIARLHERLEQLERALRAAP
ncbi:MAG: tail fiber domain-containing protein [Phycisphaerales bacterium]|nr:tail fiber domain-containing protein [Planctomycetota bacterium]MCH8508026.1 tail fiber domain-containing protein [Phycisphaerales bacterium]